MKNETAIFGGETAIFGGETAISVSVHFSWLFMNGEAAWPRLAALHACFPANSAGKIMQIVAFEGKTSLALELQSSQQGAVRAELLAFSGRAFELSSRGRAAEPCSNPLANSGRLAPLWMV